MQKRFTSEAAAVNSQGQEFPIIDRLCILPCPPISSTPIKPPLHLSPISPCIRYFLSPPMHGSSVVSGGGDGGGGDVEVVMVEVVMVEVVMVEVVMVMVEVVMVEVVMGVAAA